MKACRLFGCVGVKLSKVAPEITGCAFEYPSLDILKGFNFDFGVDPDSGEAPIERDASA